MRVALTGATGLIGSAIARRLAGDGHDVRTFGRTAKSDVRHDLAGGERLDPASLAGCGALIHAAGVVDEDFSDRLRAFAKAIAGTEALGTAARDAGIRRWIYVSSAHVYGSLEGRIDESSPPNPLSDYAIAHFASEQILRRVGAGAAGLVLRPCAVFGMPPDLGRFNRWSLIPFGFPRDAVAGRIVLKTPGLQHRNFVAADSLGSLVSRWLAEAATSVDVANAPGGESMTVYDFARLCARVAQEETGRDCAIERPVAAGSSAAALDYRSRHGAAPRSTLLDDHVRGLIRALFEKARP